MSERPAERALRLRLARRPDLPRLLRRIRRACVAHHIDYDLAGGRRVPINYMPTPVLLTRAQLASLRRVAAAVNEMIRRMPALYLADAEVRAAVPFLPDEAEWIRSSYRAGSRQPLVTRIDFDLPNHHAAPGAGMPLAFEPNGVSIGGLYYTGAGPRMLAEVTLDEATRRRLVPPPDLCVALVQQLRQHAAMLGLGPRPRIGILDNRDWTEGITEMPRLAESCERAGLAAVLGDPRDLRSTRGGRFTLAGEPVDLLYRNLETRDLADLEQTGAHLAAMREAFRRDRVFSGIAGDFEHKSLWEVLTSARTAHVVPPHLRELFRRHLLWTRLVRETRTEAPGGASVDLLPYVRANRERLVLKPNRSCGGDRVTLGCRLTARAWDRLLERAVTDPEGWVVQAFHEAEIKPFPALVRGRATTVEAYVCYGVVVLGSEVGVLGRACLRPVVNVSAGGGLLAVFCRD